MAPPHPAAGPFHNPIIGILNDANIGTLNDGEQAGLDDDEIQLVSDGAGLAVIGDPAAVERFLDTEGLSAQAPGLPRLRSVAGAGAVVAQAGSLIASGSGRWVKLTRESAQTAKKYGLRESSTTGLSTGVVTGSKGQIKGFVEFAKAPASRVNPAMLANGGAIMAQVAMQQCMNEISDYLAVIDEKVDDVLRAQKDGALARMVGVGLMVEEAMTIRQKRDRVDEITWSKVQAAPATIAEAQAYALRQLEALAEKLECQTRIGDLAETVQEAETVVKEWLAVLARCLQLQDAIAVLELDRVLDAHPDEPQEVDGHRLGLKAARQDRTERITRVTQRLLARMDTAAVTANARVLLHPGKSPAVVTSSNRVVAGVQNFHLQLGLESDHESAEARLWSEAATDAREKVLRAGAQGVEAARAFGGETRDRAGLVTGRLSSGIAARARRPRRGRGSKDDPNLEE